MTSRLTDLPLYGVCYTSPTTVCAAGGGGKSKTGVPNGAVFVDGATADTKATFNADDAMGTGFFIFYPNRVIGVAVASCPPSFPHPSKQYDIDNSILNSMQSILLFFIDCFCAGSVTISKKNSNVMATSMGNGVLVVYLEGGVPSKKKSVFLQTEV
jgi:hypothetical protein